MDFIREIHSNHNNRTSYTMSTNQEEGEGEREREKQKIVFNGFIINSMLNVYGSSAME